MKPEIQIITQILPDHSVICILEVIIFQEINAFHAGIRFAQAQLQRRMNIYSKSYNKSTYLIRLKDNIPHYKIRENSEEPHIIKKSLSGKIIIPSWSLLR